MKLGSEGLDMRQEYTMAGTLEEYVAVLPFELPRRKWCITEIQLGVEALDSDNGTQISIKSMGFESC